MSVRDSTFEREVREFYRQHNSAKLPLVKSILDEAYALQLDRHDVLKALCDKYGVKPEAAPLPAATQPSAHLAPKETEGEAFGQDKLRRTAGDVKARTDDVLLEQVRHWLLEVIQHDCDNTRELAAVANPIDALRDGGLLVWFITKLSDPKAPLPSFRWPTNIYGKLDLIKRFTDAAEKLCKLPTHVNFHPPDLVEGKNDRSVVTYLLAIGRWAVDNNRLAPGVAKMEKEIDQQMAQITEVDIEQAIAQAEASAADAEPVTVEDETPVDPADQAAIDAAVERMLSSAETSRQPSEAYALSPSPSRQVSDVLLPPSHSSPPRRAASDVFSPERVGSTPRLWHHTLEAPPTPVLSHVTPPTRPKPSASTLDGHETPSSPKRYRALRHDAVDQRVGHAFNQLLARMKQAGHHLRGRIARTHNQGEYIIYHQITHQRRVVHVRELSHALMVRVGGGWEDLEEFLARRLVDYEVAPTGTHERRVIAERREAALGRPRAGTAAHR